ncbi:hypothetical protein C0995_010166 [Termitomyces sp. Mi166|nr:hypothetical protein C0995_010166 [Termitomyces sp. Mi166\
MDINKKNVAVAEFKVLSRKPKILVISLKAGGVGLNLTTANHVFMAEGIEEVANTIKSRILQIQKCKMAIVKEAFRGSGSWGKGTNPKSIKNLKIMFTGN